MADYFKYDRDKGVIVPDTSTLLADVQNEYKLALGQTLDLSPQTPQGRLITGEVIAREGVLQYAATIANQLNPEENGGQFLASVFSLMGGSPFPATATIVEKARIYGTQGSQVLSGQEVYDDHGNRFVTQTVATIDKPDTSANPTEYYAEVTLQALVLGPLQIPANSNWVIAAPVPANLTKVKNPKEGESGVEAEPDVVARNRRRDLLAAQGSNTVRAIRARVSALAGFRSMIIRENDDSADATIDEVVMPKNSLYVCVHGAIDKDIAVAMLEAKGCGAKYTAGTSADPQHPSFGTPVTVSISDGMGSDTNGQSYQVTFTRAEELDFTCEVWYDIKQGFGNYEPEFAIQDAIQKYQNGLMPGDPGAIVGRNISAFELAGAVSYFYPGLYISACKISGNGHTAVEEVPAKIWQLLRIPVGSIVVNKGRP